MFETVLKQTKSKVNEGQVDKSQADRDREYSRLSVQVFKFCLLFTDRPYFELQKPQLLATSNSSRVSTSCRRVLWPPR
jgi:hypothetical protein